MNRENLLEYIIVIRSFDKILTKTVPDFLAHTSLDKRQIKENQLQSQRFERWLLWLAGAYFLIYGRFLASFGFGLDTDAWLMAQTAEKWRTEFAYDPARSFGNPVYEGILTLLQWNGNWLWSNWANLLIFIYLTFRIPVYFSITETQKVTAIRILWLLFPLFLKNASSSMEFVPGLWFLLESVHAMDSGKQKNVIFWTALAIFTRLEWWPILFFLKMPFWQKNRLAGILLTIGWLGYLFWAWGKNPSPFHNFETFLLFYGQRWAILMGSAGYCILPILFYLIRWNSQKLKTYWKNLATFSLLFFCLFPFEWEYAMPFFAISLVAIASHLHPLQAFLLGTGFGVFSYFQLTIKNAEFTKVDIQLMMPHQIRQAQFHQYRWAQKAQPTTNTLFLEGATLFPFPVSNWEKVLDNRVFHRKNSTFYVGERLPATSLDSLRQLGWKIEAHLPDSAFLPPENHGMH